MKESRINISVARSTRNKLADLGSKDDTFNDIIEELLRVKFNDSNMISTNVQLSGKNGLVDVKISIPKSTSALNVDEDALADALSALLEKNGITQLSDDEVPFF